MQERVGIFIDGSNLYHALRSNCGRADLNFPEFIARLCRERQLFRAYYYNILQEPNQNPDGYREQQEFLDILRRTPYLEVRLGYTKLRQGVTIEKGIDVMLATDLLRYGWSGLYETAILVSGDGDFAYAIQSAKDMGKHIEVAYFENSVSKDLLELADYSQLLNRAFFKGLWWGRQAYRKRRVSKAKKPIRDNKV